jgi:glycosyltransferase involved in cell wall biosynthesis
MRPFSPSIVTASCDTSCDAVPESAVRQEFHHQTDEGSRPLLSVVVPVFNLAETIGENVRTIRQRVEAALGEHIELIVVSDGSSDRSEERVLETDRSLARVIHYDRNLGKGYAVKVGALAARGKFISFVDADLDLDPASLADYLRLAERESLDVVIGSKRHPGSHVHYPRSRRAGSWIYQHLVRLLFQLDVRDTQVGLKLFRREVAEEVLPLLLVKQFAFDLEFLAVACALGFRRIREQPVTLRYRFTGSGVRSPAVLLALVDTAAIFYRLRILRYYQRKRSLLPEYGRAPDHKPRVTLVSPDLPLLDYPELDVLLLTTEAPEARWEAGRDAEGEVVAFLERGATPARNWLEVTIPFLANPEIAAVVTASMTPARGSVRERAAAAIAESFLGGGSHYFRFTPGNLRFVHHFPAASVIVRRDDLLALDVDSVHAHRLCAALSERGRKVLYTPESVVVVARPPLLRPHLKEIAAAGRTRGEAIRRQRVRGFTVASLLPLALLVFIVAAWPLALAGPALRDAWVGVWLVYGAAVVVVGAFATLRFQSVRVGVLAVVGVVAVHVKYAFGVLRGALHRGRD